MHNTKIIQSAIRACPICRNNEAELLHSQKFALPDGHPLSKGYNVICCQKCGFVYADTSITQHEYDNFYSTFSKYESNDTSAHGNKKPWDKKRYDKTASFISSILPDRKARILDIGCANGEILKSFKELGYKNLMGVDPSTACVENVRRFGIDAHMGTLSDNLNFGFHDCILMSHVLEHVNDLNGVLTAIYQSIDNSVNKRDKLLYIEVPNASQYKDYIFAPFQDFNTEHINHFSMPCLSNLLKLTGFIPIKDGEKIIESSPGIPYPAIYSVSAISEQRINQSSVIKDTKLAFDIKNYINQSKAILAKIEDKIQKALTKSDRLIVWGTGQLLMKLLVETSLAKADIVAFVDNNTINQGRMLRGVPIIPPEKIGKLKNPILVATLLHQRAIAEEIKTFGLPNSIIFLDE